MTIPSAALAALLFVATPGYLLPMRSEYRLMTPPQG